MEVVFRRGFGVGCGIASGRLPNEEGGVRLCGLCDAPASEARVHHLVCVCPGLAEWRRTAYERFVRRIREARKVSPFFAGDRTVDGLRPLVFPLDEGNFGWGYPTELIRLFVRGGDAPMDELVESSYGKFLEVHMRSLYWGFWGEYSRLVRAEHARLGFSDLGPLDLTPS